MIKKVQLSKNGIELSSVVLGLWRLQDISADKIVALLYHAIELGITSIDQADIYGEYNSQQYLGRALKDNKSLRDKLQIVSKAGIILPSSSLSKTGIGYYNTSVQHIIKSVEKTLSDLSTDYIDLLLIHRPDPLMHPNELDEAFLKLKQQGKVNRFGVSNFTPSQFDMLKSNMNTPLETNQVEFSVLKTNPLYDGTFDNCIQHNIKPMVWSPLGGGALFDNSNNATDDIRAVLTDVGNELGGASIDMVALAWIMMHPSNPITVIGTLKLNRIKSAMESSFLRLTNEQWFRILTTAQGFSMP